MTTPWPPTGPPPSSNANLTATSSPPSAVLIVDELVNLSIDKHAADLPFQIISQRYERARTVAITNRKNYGGLTSASSIASSIRPRRHQDEIDEYIERQQ
jgi:DNA replication protein DnaC